MDDDMTGFFPSALPAAVPTAAPPGAIGELVGVQEAEFAVFFDQQVPSAPVIGLVPGLPAAAEEGAEPAIDSLSIPEAVSLDGLLADGAIMPDALGPSVPVDVQPKLPAPAIVPTEHAANLMRVRMDGTHVATAPSEGNVLALTQLAAPEGRNAQRAQANRDIEQSDQAPRSQSVDLLTERKGVSDRPTIVEPTQPAPTVSTAPPAFAVTDVTPGVVDSASSSDVVTSDVVASPVDHAPTHALHEARRSGQETVTLHRVTGAHPPAERQILAAISASPSGRTEILLDPQELGRVRLSLEGDESALVLTIQADRVDTADLLRRNADLLVQEFREAGYQNLTFSFSDQSRDTADQKSAGPDFGTDDTLLSADLVAELSPRRTALGGLDLRL
jgi:hypothetical protein